MMKHIGTAIASAVLMASSSMALSQETGSLPLLPGGANALSESHGDWQVACRIVTSEDSSARQCSVSQRQVNQQGQQIIAVQFVPTDDGFAGAMVLPFGLAVTQPVTVAVDEGEANALPFSTCVQSGCLVPVDLSTDLMDAMRGGASLSVTAKRQDNAPVGFAISLTGFGAAMNRVTELTGDE